jgi:hypothetical protein
MPITFLHPSLLLGMLAAAVPILVHFLSRRRVVRLAFSDLRFLEAAQAQQARSLDLRRLLLLLLRVLIILLVALGAARPRLAGVAPGSTGTRSVLFIVDASASMQTQLEGGTRFTAALRACAEMTAQLPAASEVQILLCGATVTPVFAAWIPAQGPIAESLDAARPTDGSWTLAGALQEAARWLPLARAAPAEIVLLSDLQRTAEDPLALQEAVRQLQSVLPASLLIKPIGAAVPNGGISDVRLPLRAVRPGESVTLQADVLLERDQQVFWLELEGRRVAEAVASGQAGAPGRVEFAVTVPRAGNHRGLVLKESDRLPVDDARPFLLPVWKSVNVLLAHGADRGPAGRGGWRYWVKALAPDPDSPTLFNLRIVSSDQLAVGDLAGADAVVLVDPDPLGRQLLGGLREWLELGGGLALLVGDPTLQSYLEQTLLPALGWPPEAEFRSRAATAQERVSVLSPQHPVFAGLGSEPLATLSEVTWRRYFAVGEGDGRVLLTFASDAPALLERDVGPGIVMLLPFDLQLEASALPLSPMFLPLAQRVTAYLARYGKSGAALNISVGERPRFRLPGGRQDIGPSADAEQFTFWGPLSTSEATPAVLAWERGIPVLSAPVATRQGFFTFLAGSDTLGIVAAAMPAAEGEPRLTPVGEYRDWLAAAGFSQTADLSGVVPGDLNEVMRGRDIAQWLFILALLLLCAELYLARGGAVGQAAT